MLRGKSGFPFEAARRVAAFLRIAEELAAARTLAARLPRQAAYFAQQAAEKVARAVLAREGIPFGTSHNLGQMAASLPPGHAFRARISALDRLSPAATTYRYPAPAGRLAPAPSKASLQADLEEIEALLRDARTALGA